jgi:hypothetical protein
VRSQNVRNGIFEAPCCNFKSYGVCVFFSVCVKLADGTVGCLSVA